MLVVLWTDALIYLLLVLAIGFGIYASRHEHLRAPWRRVLRTPLAMASLVVLAVYVATGLLDTVHFHPSAADEVTTNGDGHTGQVWSLLDLWLTPLREQDEKTYSAPLATHGFAKEAIAHPDGTVEFTLYKAGFIVGGTGGNGTLKFKGKQYPLSVGGVSLGATIGASKAELIGEASNLKNASDIEGTYTAVQAGVAIAGGGKVAEMKNSKGVVLKIKGKQVGLELALDLSGMEVSLKK